MVLMRSRMTKVITPPLEIYEQKALIQWLSYHPLLKKFFHKTNNEGKRTPRQGSQLKQLGLRPGVSDIFIYYPSTSYHGLWIEVKRDKKYSPSERSSPTWIAQEQFLKDVKSVGFAGYFCYGWIDGKRIIERYLET